MSRGGDTVREREAGKRTRVTCPAGRGVTALALLRSRRRETRACTRGWIAGRVGAAPPVDHRAREPLVLNNLRARVQVSRYMRARIRQLTLRARLAGPLIFHPQRVYESAEYIHTYRHTHILDISRRRQQ